MKRYFRRFFGFFCLSMMLALAAGFFPGNKRVLKNANAVFLSALGLNETAVSPLCLDGPVDLHPGNLEAFPLMAKAISSPVFSKMERTRITLLGPNLDAFIGQFERENKTRLCFRFEGRTYALIRTLRHDLGSLYLVGLNHPPSNMGILSQKDLQHFPSLAHYVTSLLNVSEKAENLNREIKTPSKPPKPEKGPDFASGDMDKAILQAQAMFQEIERRGRRTVTLIESRNWLDLYSNHRVNMQESQWIALCSTLETATNRLRFKVGSYLIVAHRELIEEDALVPLPYFDTARYSLAALLLVLGIVALRNVYLKGPGIRLNPIWSAVTGDTLIILFLSFGAFCLLDTALIHIFHAIPAFPDDIVRGMCSVAYLPVVFFFAVFAANLGEQSVTIAERGLLLHYPGKNLFLDWEAIKGIRLKETSVLVGRSGFLLPRKLQTKLIIETEDGDKGLFEPGLRRTKGRIISELRAKAPERLQRDLGQISQEW